MIQEKKTITVPRMRMPKGMLRLIITSRVSKVVKDGHADLSHMADVVVGEYLAGSVQIEKPDQMET